MIALIFLKITTEETNVKGVFSSMPFGDGMPSHGKANKRKVWMRWHIIQETGLCCRLPWKKVKSDLE